MIGDFEKEAVVNEAVQHLAEYREDGTPYAYGRAIQHIVDTVHFAKSHHSRLLQLADTFLWTRQLLSRTEEQSPPRKQFIEFIRHQTDTAWDHKYKWFPPEF